MSKEDMNHSTSLVVSERMPPVSYTSPIHCSGDCWLGCHCLESPTIWRSRYTICKQTQQHANWVITSLSIQCLQSGRVQRAIPQSRKRRHWYQESTLLCSVEGHVFNDSTRLLCPTHPSTPQSDRCLITIGRVLRSSEQDSGIRSVASNPRFTC